MKRIILALAVGSALFGVVAFAAAAMNLDAGSLSQGWGNVTDCADGETVNLDWNIGGGPSMVTSVDVDAPDACAGATARVDVYDGITYQESASCVADGDGDCTADLADISVEAVDMVMVVLAGP